MDQEFINCPSAIQSALRQVLMQKTAEPLSYNDLIDDDNELIDYDMNLMSMN
jgi:hypothetical protein